MSLNVVVIVVLSRSRVCFFVIPLTAVCKASLFFTITQSLFKLTSTESMMPSNHLILSYPHLFLPSVFPSIMIFSSELALCIKWPKYWSFKFSISDYSGLISFRIDWFDLAVQGTLKSLSNITVWKHQFFSTQPSLWSKSLIHTGLLENHSFDYVDICWQTDVSAFFFNELSRFIIAFLPRRMHLLISWLQSPYTVILGPMKVKSVTASTFPPIYLPWSDGTGCHDRCFLMVDF